MASGPETNNQPRNQEQHPPQSEQHPAVSNYSTSGGGNVHPPPDMNYPQQPYPPPQGGYPGYGYGPYPPAYAHDPAGVYYPTQQPYCQAQEGAASSCFRCVYMIMLLSLMLTLLASLIIFMVAKPGEPTFKVESLSVSNFSINPVNKGVTGKWETKVAIDNGRYFRVNGRVDSSLLYLNNPLTMNGGLSNGYYNDGYWGNSQNTLEFKFEGNNAPAPTPDMEKEVKEGERLTFGLKLNIDYVYRSGGIIVTHKSGRAQVECKDLKVNMPVNATSGSLADGKKDCDKPSGI